jgi:hypothetical protein
MTSSSQDWSSIEKTPGNTAASARYRARKKAEKLGVEGPPLLKRRVRPWRPPAKTDEERLIRAQERRIANNASSARYRKNNPDKRKKTVTEYDKRNREANRARYRRNPWDPARRHAYKKVRLETDLQFKLRTYLSKRMVCAIKRGHARKSNRTITLLGCSIPELRAHIEAQFKDGMTWENWGAWHIDHRRPCASFNLTDPAQQSACFHYSNLQPLWAAENLSKGARLLESEFARAA